MAVKTQKKPLFFVASILFVLLIAGLIWYKWPYYSYEGTGMAPQVDIADNIASGTDNKFFAESIFNAGYDTFLHGGGPFTVFVPTNAAFENLPNETKAYLASEDNQGAARQVLLYHVVKGKYLTSDFKDGMKLKTVQGDELTITRKDNFWVIDGYAYIETQDIEAKNGVIHMTTNYILPPSIAEQNQ